jgi:hypothetical protein
MGLGVFGLTLAAYTRYLDTGFAATDSLPLVESSRLTGIDDALRLFAGPVMAGTRFVVVEIVYRPFVSLSFGLDHLVWGMNPFGYHLTNLAVHLCAVLGLWLLARRLGMTWWSSLAGAAVFSLHPLVLASVPVIARRDSLFPVAAFAGAAVCVLSGGEATGRRRLLLGGGAGVFLCIALLSKESAFAAFGLLPVLLVASAWGRGASPRQALSRLWILAPFVGLAGGLFLVRWSILGGLGGVIPSENLLLIDFDRYGQIVGAYTRTLLWPFASLASSTREVWRIAAAALVAGLAIAMLWLPRRQAAVFGAGVLWVVTFGVFCTVLRIGTIAWLAYFGLIGIGLLYAAGIEGAVARLRQPRAEAPWHINLARGASIGLLLGLFGYALTSLSASALFRDYDQWRLAGATTNRFMQALTTCVAGAPDAKRVNFVSLPSGFDDGRIETSLLGVTLLEEWTVESAIRVAFPDRALVTHVSSVATVRGAPETLQFRCGLIQDGVELETVFRPG